MKKISLVTALILLAAPYSQAQSLFEMKKAVQGLKAAAEQQLNTAQPQAQQPIPAVQQEAKQPSATAQAAATGQAKQVADSPSPENLGMVCRGSRWLGIEEPYSCVATTAFVCKSLENLGKRIDSCKGVKEFDDDNAYELIAKIDFKPIIDKAGLLGSTITEADLSERVKSIIAFCDGHFSSGDSVDAASGGLYCYTGGLASLGMHAAQERGACQSPLISPALKQVCAAKVNELATKLFAFRNKLAVAKKSADIQYMATTGAPAKKKIDELISAGERSPKALESLCEQFLSVLTVKRGEFLPKCQTYSMNQLDAATGGKASKQLNEKNKTESLANVYGFKQTVEICYDARKAYQLRLITDGELALANDLAAKAEKKLLDAGANKGQALQIADEQMRAARTNRSDPTYTDSRKRGCQEALNFLKAGMY